MKYLMSAALLFIAFPFQAHADLCGKLKPILEAFDKGAPTPNPFALNEGETECVETVDDEGFGIYGCYWDNTSFIHYDGNDLTRLADGIRACTFVEEAEEISDEKGTEYSFIYGNLTIMYVGNDDEGIYLEVVEDWFPFF